MLRRVVELLATRKGQLESCILKAWRIVPLCLMWCISREQNAWSFEVCETPVLELKTYMFKSLYAWSAVYNSPRFSCFTNSLGLCSSISPYLGVSFLKPIRNPTLNLGNPGKLPVLIMEVNITPQRNKTVWPTDSSERIFF